MRSPLIVLVAVRNAKHGQIMKYYLQVNCFSDRAFPFSTTSCVLEDVSWGEFPQWHSHPPSMPRWWWWWWCFGYCGSFGCQRCEWCGCFGLGKCRISFLFVFWLDTGQIFGFSSSSWFHLLHPPRPIPPEEFCPRLEHGLKKYILVLNLFSQEMINGCSLLLIT